ncbi:MAG TPA: sodium:calcium antiporter [Rhizomicrobium sp.]|nr:sodium:calcium antiporter [Rhizomicrobium sp.]
MVYVFLGIGFALLLIGSEAVLRGGTGVFRALGLPPVFVSLLIVSLAMSAPELSVAIQASLRGMSDIALGDVVGSNIANMLLVCGIGALMRPMPAPPRVVFRDGGVLIAASIALVFMAFDGFIPKPFGAVLLAAWIGYLVLVSLTDWGRPPQLLSDETRNGEVGGALGLFLLAVGVVCLFFGARLAIDFALLIARNFHLPQLAVALTLLAIGTTLPELISTFVSATRGHPNLISGRLVASSVFNILLVLGIAAAVRPISVAPMLAQFDAPLMAACAIVIPLLMLFGWRLTRGQGLLLLLGYAGYIVSVGLRSGLHLLG